MLACTALSAMSPALSTAHARPTGHPKHSTRHRHARRHHRALSSHRLLARRLTAAPAPASAQTGAWPGNPFSPTSFWNAPLSNSAQLSPNSRGLTQELIRQVGVYGPWMNTWQYSVPVYLVAARQPTVHVSLDQWGPDLQAALNAVPIPAGAKPALGTDESMTVWQPSTNRLWDFWKMQLEPDGWHARWGGEMDNVSSNPGYFTHWGVSTNWGGTATGLPLLGGLITFADLQRGYINHALAMAIPQTESRYWSWPAQRTDGSAPAGGVAQIPEGTRFRLDPSLDIASLNLPPIVRMIAQAAQRYGIVVRDKAGAVTFYGQTATGSYNPWGTFLGKALPGKLLAAFPWSHLEALTTRLSCCWAPS